MSIYVNRTLNMRKIKALGFDMDYTLVRYNTENFERLAYYAIIDKLVEKLGYPEEIKNLKFDFKRMIQGLVINKANGHILKLSLHGRVKTSYFGTTRLEFKTQQEIYGGREIELGHPDIVSLDTNFAMSKGILYGELVEFFKTRTGGPNFAKLSEDLQAMLDRCHQDGTLKNEVRRNISKYIIQDPELPLLMENYKKYGKKLILITNSDYSYSKLLMEYTFDPFLKDHKSWHDLFDVVITYSCKPRFFTDRSYFLKIDPATQTMTNYDGPITHGIYQGGNAGKLQKDLGLKSDEILYLGDHIYGDVVAIKKTFNWRTALVFDPLVDELKSIQAVKPLQAEIDRDMQLKNDLEHRLNDIYAQKIEQGMAVDQEDKDDIYQQIDDLNAKISKNIEKYQEAFNPYWGELMRSGLEESRLAGQVEKYACLYFEKVSDLLRHSPRSYFIPERRVLPHER